MPKITSTPTASSERTRLCAPVMPVAGSGARGSGRAVVSTPASEAAASRLADSLGVGVLIAAFLLGLERAGSGGAVRRSRGRGPANKNPLVPQARRGQRVGRQT